MVRLHWHVEDGRNAFVPPGAMRTEGTDVAHADVQIEARCCTNLVAPDLICCKRAVFVVMRCRNALAALLTRWLVENAAGTGG